MAKNTTEQSTNMRETPEMIILKKWHLRIVVIMSILIPALAVASVFYNNFQTIKDDIHETKLYTERNYAKKNDVHEMKTAINKIAVSVSRIEGYINKSTSVKN